MMPEIHRPQKSPDDLNDNISAIGRRNEGNRSNPWDGAAHGRRPANSENYETEPFVADR